MSQINLILINDNDLIAATGPDGITYSVTGAQFKALFVNTDDTRSHASVGNLSSLRVKSTR